MFPKSKKKPKNKKKTVPLGVMKRVVERSKSICEYCRRNNATQPHHIHFKSRGGLNIPINILHVCGVCHEHKNLKFLDDARGVLKERINELFNHPAEAWFYSEQGIALRLEMKESEVKRQMDKGFLQNVVVRNYRHSTGEQIMRWLGVKM